MNRPKILIQLDVDSQPSVFDRVVAVDAGVEQVFAYGSVAPEDVEALVHGAMFTRGGPELKHTALFIGGRNIARVEELLAAVKKTFLGPVRCSVMIDANGANTTAAAAVLSAMQHLELEKSCALVLGGTGPVGQRAALLLASRGASVWLTSRSKDRGEDACDRIREVVPGAKIFSLAPADAEALTHNAERYHLVVAAGAAGVRLLPKEVLHRFANLRVGIDLNAVPPTGIEGVDPMDRGKERVGVLYYGALGVGGVKMKIHRAVVQQLFQANDQVFDALEIFQLAFQLATTPARSAS